MDRIKSLFIFALMGGCSGGTVSDYPSGDFPQVGSSSPILEEVEIVDPNPRARAFPPPAAVVVTAPGVVHLPSGNLLDVTGSKTAGLQEAVNFAAAYGWDLFVVGSSSSPVVYPLSESLNFPALQGKSIRFDDVVLQFGPEVTDAAVSFDSTMIVDFKLRGEIRAPFASAGILFSPRNIVPLDGIRYGFTSEVDSRFRVEKIVAKDYGVFFDRRRGGIEYNSYYFGSVTAETEIGKPEAATGSIWERKSEIDASGALKPLPFDLFEPFGSVVVYPPTITIAGDGMVAGPDGAVHSTPGSKTAGLQEAIDLAAQTHSNLIVFGRGLQIKKIVDAHVFPRTGFYFVVDRGLNFGALENQFVYFFNVTIVAPINLAIENDAEYPVGEPRIANALNVPMITISDAKNVDFEITGQIYGRMTMPIDILFSPTSAMGIRNSQFRIGHLPGSFDTNVRFSTVLGPIENNVFLFHEILQAKEGIAVDSGGSHCFCSNYVRGVHVHGNLNAGVRMSPLVEGNRFDIILDPDSSQPSVGVAVAGQNNSVFVHLGVPGFSVGISVDPASANNSVVYSQIVAKTPSVVSGSNSIAQGVRP